MRRTVILTAVLLFAVSMSLAQAGSTGQTGAQDQGTAGASGTSTGTIGSSTTNTDQTGSAAGATSPDQGSTSGAAQSTDTGAAADQKAGDQLPQTASPLPLLGLLGLTAVGGALFTRRKNR